MNPCPRCDVGPHGDTETDKTVCQIRFLILDTTLPAKLAADLATAADDLEAWETDRLVEIDAQRREDGYQMHGGSARGTGR